MTDEYIEREYITCTHCNGTGETYYNVSPFINQPIYELTTCPRCRGRGYYFTEDDNKKVCLNFRDKLIKEVIF